MASRSWGVVCIGSLRWIEVFAWIARRRWGLWGSGVRFDLSTPFGKFCGNGQHLEGLSAGKLCAGIN